MVFRYKKIFLTILVGCVFFACSSEQGPGTTGGDPNGGNTGGTALGPVGLVGSGGNQAGGGDGTLPINRPSESSGPTRVPTIFYISPVYGEGERVVCKNYRIQAYGGILGDASGYFPPTGDLRVSNLSMRGCQIRFEISHQEGEISFLRIPDYLPDPKVTLETYVKIQVVQLTEDGRPIFEGEKEYHLRGSYPRDPNSGAMIWTEDLGEISMTPLGIRFPKGWVGINPPNDRVQPSDRLNFGTPVGLMPGVNLDHPGEDAPPEVERIPACFDPARYRVAPSHAIWCRVVKTCPVGFGQKLADVQRINAGQADLHEADKRELLDWLMEAYPDARTPNNQRVLLEIEISKIVENPCPWLPAITVEDWRGFQN